MLRQTVNAVFNYSGIADKPPETVQIELIQGIAPSVYIISDRE